MELTLRPGNVTLSVDLTEEALQLAVESKWGDGILAVPVGYRELLLRACGAGALFWGSRVILRRGERYSPLRRCFKGKRIRL